MIRRNIPAAAMLLLSLALPRVMHATNAHQKVPAGPLSLGSAQGTLSYGGSFTLLAAKEWQTFRGKCVKVHDGDTVTIEAKGINGKLEQYRVRLLAIDAPELAQPYGLESQGLAAGEVLGKKVSVVWKTREKYGRILGVVYVGDPKDKSDWAGSLNRELIEQGAAWSYLTTDPTLLRCETAARTAKAGLWKAGSPVKPWEWRKGKR